MDTSIYRFDGSHKFGMDSVSPSAKNGLRDKAAGLALLEENKKRMEGLQAALYAENRRSLLVVLQAMDAAGKDSIVKHVFTGFSPEGISVANFKRPTDEEIRHDYLWRVHNKVPGRGTVGVFNRSHYEEVLVAKVENLPKTQPLPPDALHDIWHRRYRHICEFEQYLAENGTTILKFYLHLSPETQAKRLLARLDNPDKNWKFEAGDLATRAKWNDYMRAYRDAINQTAKPHAPWYVVPADHKWYTRAVVSQVVADTLQAMCPQYPKAGRAQQKKLEGYREQLRSSTGAEKKA